MSKMSTKKTIQALQAMIGVVFGLSIAYVAYENSIEGRPDLTPGRLILAAFLVTYSVAQIIRLVKGQLTPINIISFPIIYVVFGIFWEYSSRGYIKNWAPATQDEANRMNLICLLIIVILVGLACLTTFKNKRSTNVT